MIDYKDIRHLELEVSSLCNALCPQCGRRASGGVKNPLFTETYMTLQNIKDWFSVDFIKQIHQLGMCGNYGDAMTNPDLIPILQYFKSINPDIRMQMNSNASGRDPEFWRDLGEIFKENGTLVFSVDGLEDTNWIYRRGTYWDKIMTAMTNYKSTGAKARWEFLVFRHNQHQIEEARKLSNELGIETFFPKKAFGFYKDDDGENNMHVYGTEGIFEYTIKPSIDIKGKNWNPRQDIQLGNVFNDTVEMGSKSTSGYLKDIKLQLKKSEKSSTHVLHWTKKEVDLISPLNEHDKKLSKCDIQCEAIDRNQIWVNHAGLVFPCCYTASFYDDANSEVSLPLKNFINDYGKEKISLHHTSLKDIIDGDMYTNKWIESFKDRDIRNKRLKACSLMCGVET
jgi:MoaA/NifB/PqqE/SkfB family radical SAM enzyme